MSTRPLTPKHKLALVRAVGALFDKAKWIELGLLTDSTVRIQHHPRLLQSLRFGDEDYRGHASEVVEAILSQHPEAAESIESLIDVPTWLRETDPKLYADVYGTTVVPATTGTTGPMPMPIHPMSLVIAGAQQMTAVKVQHPRTFVSYTHDSEPHRAAVLSFAQSLRDNWGIDVRMDRFEPSPKQGWPRWMREQIESADFILMVCTPTYRKRFEGKEEKGLGLGATWEGFLTETMLYSDGALNSKCIPVIFSKADVVSVPSVLSAATRYLVPDETENLVRHMTGQPEVVPAPLGKIPVLKPRDLPPAAPSPVRVPVSPFRPAAPLKNPAPLFGTTAIASAPAAPQTTGQMSERDEFEELTDAAKRALAPLSNATQEALFAHTNREDYVPDEWDDGSRRALQYKEVKYNPDENGLRPNLDKPPVGNAHHAIRKLEKWLDSERCTAEFLDWYSDRYHDHPDVEDRSFWDRHLW